MGRTFIPVKVLRSFKTWKPGDMILLEDWKAKELWESGIVEIIDESEKIISELDQVIAEERANEPIMPLPTGLYSRAEFYIYYLENYVRKKTEIEIDVLNAKMTKLSNLKKKYEHLKKLRFKKILNAIMFRPGSLEILNRLAPEEKKIYLQISQIRNEWLGES
ncbi:MAG: Uncharacterized protein XD54_1061 [Thermococcus sibiricus]|uniref:Uncharacterized protein n=3 Tax=Thermococcaceae TaxID=2259 RepID=C6A4N7_THESM|nr:hypothetical protein TSIB_1531 [Thermococcus sibiricus MM 739]KUK17623.1 MAG: Uncharacterized protein XD54_1061 [Thermococcus sibiricus]KUK28677.1 MAG: Uncharacterized protein XD61_0768 [Thermococcus sp. 40_45]